MRVSQLKWKGILTSAILAATAGVAGAGERWALLVGASDYASAAGGASSNWESLEGPRNDVALMYATLTQEGIPQDRIRVLADTLDRSVYRDAPVSDGKPVREEILESLDWLTRNARAGDQALVYYSGHGSYIPERLDKPGGPAEDDGFDEILVPLAAGYWDETVDSVSGQVLDDEIGEKINALMAEGVFVWLVVDACHSGTVARSSEPADGIARGLDPVRDLGVPQADIDAARQRGALIGSTRSARSLTREHSFEGLSNQGGNFVAFYAAPPARMAIERIMPKNAALADRRAHGVMTWNLAQALRGAGATDYATLARQVIAGAWEWGAAAPLPQFEGELGAAPMVGAGTEKFWGIESRGRKLFLTAGQLENIGPGSILAVQQKGDDPDRALFFARVQDAGIEESLIEVLPSSNDRPSYLAERVARDGMKDPGEWIEERSQSLIAKVIDHVPAFVLKTAVAGTGEDADNIRSTLSGLSNPAREDPGAPAIEIEDMAGAADVLLAIRDGRVWFTAPDAGLVTEGPNEAYSLSMSEADPGTLSAVLRRIAKARNLTRTARYYNNTPTAQSLSISIAIRQGRQLENGKCELAPEDPVSVPQDAVVMADAGHPLSGPFEVHHCDQVYYSLRNNSTELLDLTPLYIDPWSQISFLGAYRENRFGALRLAPGQTRIMSYAENTASRNGHTTPAGAAQVIWIAVEGDPDRINGPDFRHLAHAMPESDRRDAGAPEGLRALLQDAAFGTARAASGEPIGRSGIIAIPFQTFAPQ